MITPPFCTCVCVVAEKRQAKMIFGLVFMIHFHTHMQLSLDSFIFTPPLLCCVCLKDSVHKGVSVTRTPSDSSICKTCEH